MTWLGPEQVVQVATPSARGLLVPLDLSPAGENRAPQVAEDAAGDATVVWYTFGLNFLVEAATVTDGMPSAPVTLSAVGKKALLPTVAMNDRGGYHRGLDARRRLQRGRPGVVPPGRRELRRPGEPLSRR